MPPESNRRLLVQSDWDVFFREKTGKFWITMKDYSMGSGESIHCTVEINKQNDDSILFSPEDSRFTVVYQQSQNYLEVKYHDTVKNIKISQRFKSPSSEYTLHDVKSKVNTLDVTSGGLAASTCENSSSILVWESTTGAIRRKLTDKHVGDIYTVKYFPSGLVLCAAGADTRINIWSAETGQCAATILGHRAGVQDIDFIDRGKNIVSCSRDGTCKLWDVSKQTCLSTLSSQTDLPITDVVNCILIHTAPSGVDLGESNIREGESGTSDKILISGSESGLVTLYSLNSKLQIDSIKMNSAVNSMCSLNNDMIGIGTQNGEISLHDLRNLRTPVYKLNTHRNFITDICKYKQGFIYSSGDGSVVCVDEMGNNSWELPGPDLDTVYKVKYQSGCVYTTCRDGLIRIYDKL